MHKFASDLNLSEDFSNLYARRKWLYRDNTKRKNVALTTKFVMTMLIEFSVEMSY